MSNVVAMRQQDQSASQLPYNIDLERGFLGVLLMRNSIYQRVGVALRPEHFYEPVHQRIYEVAGEVIADGGVANPITLKTYLGDADLGGVTVSEYLARLCGQGTEPINAVPYARDISVLAARRTMIEVTEQIRAMAMDSPVGLSPADLLATFEGKMEAIRPMMGGRSKGFEPFGIVTRRAMEKIQDDWRNPGTKKGLSTGFEKLDDYIGGLEAPNLIVIGGRPGMAKSGLAVNICINCALQLADLRAEGHKSGVIGFFSLEMSAEQIAERAMAAEAAITAFRVKRRKSLTESDVGKLAEAERRLSNLPIEIDQTGEIPVAQILSRARDLHKRKGIELLVIDYLQIITGFESKSRDTNRTQDLTKITSALKGLAKELHIPIVLLAQVSREVDKREDRRPQKADLRESGSIEQDADQILFIYREEYYLANEKPLERRGAEALAKWERDMRACKGIAEIIVAKQRHGATGTVTMGYDAKRILFMNEPEEREIEPEQARQRAEKPPTLPKESAVLFGVLKSLTLSRSIVATNDQRSKDRKLCKGARMVELEAAREAFLAEAMPGEPIEKVKPRFQRAFLALKAAGLAHYHAPPDDPIMLWLPSMVADV